MPLPIAQCLRRVITLAVVGDGGAYWVMASTPEEVFSNAFDEIQRPEDFPGSRLFVVRVNLGAQPLAQAIPAAVERAVDDEDLADRVTLNPTARALAWLAELPSFWQERAKEHMRRALGADPEALIQVGCGEALTSALTDWASQVGLELRAPHTIVGQLEILHDLLCYSLGFRALVVTVVAPAPAYADLRELAALAELTRRLHLALVVASPSPMPPELIMSTGEPAFRDLGAEAPPPTLVDPLRRAFPDAPDLRSALRHLRERASAVRENLDELALALSNAPQPEADRLLADLLELAESPHEAVHEAARTLFGDTKGLEAALERLAAYERIAGRVPALIRTHRIFTEVVLPADDPLALSAATLRSRFTVPSLLASLSPSAALLADCEAFERTLIDRYAAHHGTVTAELAQLHATLTGAAERAGALRKLNRTGALGPAVAEEALAEFDTLRTWVAPCTRPFDAIQATVPCPACGLTLADGAPRKAMEACLDAIDAGLTDQLRRLSHHAVREVLRRNGSDALAAFLDIVQVSDLSALPGVLTDEVCAHLERLLDEGRDV